MHYAQRRRAPAETAIAPKAATSLKGVASKGRTEPAALDWEPPAAAPVAEPEAPGLVAELRIEDAADAPEAAADEAADAPEAAMDEAADTPELAAEEAADRTLVAEADAELVVELPEPEAPAPPTPTPFAPGVTVATRVVEGKMIVVATGAVPDAPEAAMGPEFALEMVKGALDIDWPSTVKMTW